MSQINSLEEEMRSQTPQLEPRTNTSSRELESYLFIYLFIYFLKSFFEKIKIKLKFLVSQQPQQQSGSNDKKYIEQIQHLSELLSETEETVERLLNQEKVLKAEIRRLDGLEGIQNTQLPYEFLFYLIFHFDFFFFFKLILLFQKSIRYLKNVILRFFEGGDKEVSFFHFFFLISILNSNLM